MHICLVVNALIPVKKYGGTERIVQWLAQEYVRMGHQVTLVAKAGSVLDGVTCLPAKSKQEAWGRVPATADIVHFHAWEPSNDFPFKWLYTLHGNSTNPQSLPAHTVCISADHARRHGRSVYVYNGVDPTEFVFKEKKQDHLLFFSKVRRRVKGARRALKLAKDVNESLVVAGGYRLDLIKVGGLLDSLRPGIKFVGEAGGTKKASLFSNAKALVFPIDWEEPFGLVMIESLMSGTPVIATPRGSVPELIPHQVGALFSSDDEFPEAMERALACSPHACRDWAMVKFSSKVCAQNYLNLYERVVDGESIFDNP